MINFFNTDIEVPLKDVELQARRNSYDGKLYVFFNDTTQEKRKDAFMAMTINDFLHFRKLMNDFDIDEF